MLEEIIDYKCDIKSLSKSCGEYIRKYDIQHGFGNKEGKHICKLPSYTGSTGSIYRGYEILNLSEEEIFYAIQDNVDNIKSAKNINTIWNEELRKFDINLPISSRIYALASVISGAIPYEGMFQ